MTFGVAVVGPTATGKSDLAVALALEVGGEVVNADSMQLYRGMDIGTAKLTAAERRGVPHHLLDVLDVREEASVAAYQRQALAAVDEISSRGQVPLLVGGSGLYVAAVLDGLDFPGTDADLRARLEAELAERGPGAMHAHLAEVDAQAAAAILPSNGRRIVRALEVVELTGRPFRASLPRDPAAGDRRWLRLGLAATRDRLDDRVGRRVDRMWAAGLVEEVRGLANSGLREGRTAARALGYAQVLSSLDGRCTADEAREQTVRATRRFVRRQESWFRRDKGIVWLEHDAADLLARAVTAVRTAQR